MFKPRIKEIRKRVISWQQNFLLECKTVVFETKNFSFKPKILCLKPKFCVLSFSMFTFRMQKKFYRAEKLLIL